MITKELKEQVKAFQKSKQAQACALVKAGGYRNHINQVRAQGLNAGAMLDNVAIFLANSNDQGVEEVKALYLKFAQEHLDKLNNLLAGNA